MITRIWHGRVKKNDVYVYKHYVEETGLKEYRSIRGNISAKIFLRFENDICHVLTISEWESLESIQEFAGKNYEKAKYYEQDKIYLLELEDKVMHYDTFSYS